ncbi:GTPase HflX [Lachnospiraceae bacterium MD1]|uniref:GTPase HflX n=1 Tax=Variimorphobacter saccharofermentans TaxID=2755051 RepID=A0A839K281_9FIRM|nr:GTPase HflX [Variimorphobacter saccharofermentans]MBB2184023.1 GTPase HflX [Variimorphobacter saccharofermentans]
MAEMYEMKEQEERFVLVGVAVSDNDDTEQSLEELEELATTAGAITVGKIIQNRESIHPGTYIGKGKIDEVKALAIESDATGVVCDDELSPAQLKNLEDALQMKVLDRTILILDIFANRASTKEGKIQVELAQLRYRSTRLIGLRNSLSRLGGGIGTRGPGEKKLEVDRRLIKDRISQLKRELDEVKQNRETTRGLRSKNHVPVIAIVGYTNAGKSTLLNYLTGAGVLSEDKLFATLDPTTRSLQLQNGQQVLFTDTVGFIRKLPHHLIEAFRSTLEEAKYSDIILHVVDSSNPDADRQMHIVYETLNKLGIQDKTIITAFNKQDQVEPDQVFKDFKADYTIKISAKTGQDIDKLLVLIEKILNERKILIEKVFSYQEAGKIQTIRKYGQLLEEEYQQEGIYIKAYVPKEIFQVM